jgi:iron(III) transport system substrate-binding protein
MSAFGTRNRWVGAFSCAASAALLITGCGSGSGAKATSSTDRLSLTPQAACDAGNKEGSVNYLSRTDPEVFAKEVASFTKAHPQIKVKYTSMKPSDATQRVITEVQARHALSVDATTTDLTSAAPLFDQKLVHDVDYQKLGISQNLILNNNGVATFRVFRDALGLAYNPKLSQVSSLPRTWDELVDPKWKNKVVVDPRGIYLGVLAAAWGEPKTMTWFKKFRETDKPLVINGTTDSIAKVVSGEAHLTTSATASAVIEQQKAGAPVAIHYLDVVSSQDKYGVLLKGAQHPNAAACFLSWWGSAEGQAQQLKYEYKANTDVPGSVPSTANLAFVVKPADQAVVTKATEEISKILAP